MAATVIPDVPEYSGDVPLIGQGEVEFSQNAQDNLVYQETLAPNINATVAQMNVLSNELNDALTVTVIANDSELFDLPPNAPIRIEGLTGAGSILVGTLINNMNVGGKRAAIIHEPATDIYWGYSTVVGAPAGFFGELTNLTDKGEVSNVFGGYTERVTSAIESIDASMYNVCVALALTGAKAIAFINVPTQMYTCQVTISDAGSLVITLPPGTETAGGVAPTFTASGKDKLIFQTSDQGATWDLSVINDIKVIA